MFNVVRSRLFSGEVPKTSLVRAQPRLSDEKIQKTVENLRKNFEETKRLLREDPDKYVYDWLAEREYAEIHGADALKKGTKP